MCQMYKSERTSKVYSCLVQESSSGVFMAIPLVHTDDECPLIMAYFYSNVVRQSCSLGPTLKISV
jgi:hypothetical protein